MMSVKIHDLESIKSLKINEKSEKARIIEIISRNSSDIDCLLECLNFRNLIHISNEYYNDMTIGYALGVHAAQTISNIYTSLVNIHQIFIKDVDKIKNYSNLEDIQNGINNTLLKIDEIACEIYKLLTCEDFLHCLNFDNKLLVLKRNALSLPNPHQIPKAYDIITKKNTKAMYRIYSDFISYFVGNWNFSTKRLTKIKESFNVLYNLCPIIRLTIVKDAIQNEKEIYDLPLDILQSLVSVDSENILQHHSSYIISLICKYQYKSVNIDILMHTLQQVVNKLSNPIKNVVELNIIIENLVKAMTVMQELRNNRMLNTEQVNILNKIEAFIANISKQHTITIKEMHHNAQNMKNTLLQQQNISDISIGF